MINSLSCLLLIELIKRNGKLLPQRACTTW
jgi:hypothetical protein